MRGVDILFTCGLISGVASLLDIIKTVINTCRQIKNHYREKNARPVDETEQAE